MKRQWLIDARRELGLTQEELAVQAGVSVATVSLYEKGKTCKKVNARTVRKVCEVLNVDWHRFYE